MSVPPGAWLIVGEAAEKYRMMAGRSRNPHIAAILRMAANVLEQAAWELANDRISHSTLENLEVMENLLKTKGQPFSPVRTARELARRYLSKRLLEISEIAADDIGLPSYV